MRIGQVTHRYLPSIGGIENYVYRLSRDLSKRGHEVEVFTATPDPARTPDGIAVHSVPALFRRYTNPIPIGLSGMLRSSELDLVHFHSPWYLTSIMPLVRGLRPPSVMTVHGLVPERRSVPRDIALGFLYLPALVAISKCSAVVALTLTEERKIRRLFSIPLEKLHAIPNGIDLACCSRAGKFRRYDSLNLKPKLLFVGRISPDSRTDLAIRAFASTVYRYPEAIFTLAGPGTDKFVSRLARHFPPHIQEKMRGIGVVSKDDLCDLYSSHHVFISLGTWEGLPTRVLEAMLHGCVPLVANSGGLSDVIIDGKNGILLPEADVGSVRIALERMFDQPDRLISLGNAAVTTVRDHYSWADVFERLVALYESVLGQ